jgi:hypothetical protein
MHPSVPHEFYAYCETCLAYWCEENGT